MTGIDWGLNMFENRSVLGRMSQPTVFNIRNHSNTRGGAVTLVKRGEDGDHVQALAGSVVSQDLQFRLELFRNCASNNGSPEFPPEADQSRE